jgi:hypothetical protein
VVARNHDEIIPVNNPGVAHYSARTAHCSALGPISRYERRTKKYVKEI